MSTLVTCIGVIILSHTVPNQMLKGLTLRTSIKFVNKYLIPWGTEKSYYKKYQWDFLSPFLVAKVLQPVWKCHTIAGGKSGNQNTIFIADVCQITNLDHDLSYLYPSWFYLNMSISYLLNLRTFSLWVSPVLAHKNDVWLCPMSTWISPGASRRFRLVYVCLALNSSPVLWDCVWQ